MNNDPEPRKDEFLLDAVLRDDAWQAVDQDMRSVAVGAFRRHQRRRRQLRWAAGTFALMTAIALTLRNWRQPTAVNPASVGVRVTQSSNPGNIHYLSDEELLKLFPPGSCLFVEINDQKQLIFLDREVEQTQVAALGAH